VDIIENLCFYYEPQKGTENYKMLEERLGSFIKVFKSNIVFVMCALLSGCLTTVSPDTYDAKKFYKEEKGIAILLMTEHAPETMGSTDIALNYTIKKLGSDQTYHIDGSNSLLPGVYNNHNYSPYVMMLDPGIYYIDSINLRRIGYLIRWYPSPGLKVFSKGVKKKYLFTLGVFEVKPGKVSYFGHLKHSKTFPFKIVNELKKVKADLKNAEMEDLAHKVAFDDHFYQAGSFMVEGKDGKRTFIPREKFEEKRNQFLGSVLDFIISEKVRNKKNKSKPEK
tara:strand:+ start:192 stop:1031 length:840 start_codon:yes stop_codon:yes gene_type:complete